MTWTEVKGDRSDTTGYGYCFPTFGSLFLRGSINRHDPKMVAQELRERYASWQNT